MSELNTIDDKRVKFSEAFIGLNKALNRAVQLFAKLELTEIQTKEFIKGSVKSKSAWYACLVNSNIDVLLIPDFIESKQSRNILIKKETDQYVRSLSEFSEIKNQDSLKLYNSLLYCQSEEPKAAGLDLFSNQAQTVQSCPAELKALFTNSEQSYSSISNLEKSIFLFLDWIQNEAFKDSKRQSVLFLNYQFWKQFGVFTQRINVELFLFEHLNRKQFDEAEFLNNFFLFMNAAIESELKTLKTVYKNKVSYHEFNNSQKLVFNYLYENNLNLDLGENATCSEYLKISLRSKGFINQEDFKNAADQVQFSVELNTLLQSGLLIIEKSNGEISLFLNTSAKNKNSRLYTYQNIAENKSELSLEEFKNQILIKPSTVVQFEQNSVNSEVTSNTFTAKRQKAFFG
jgi:hypothetical protein